DVADVCLEVACPEGVGVVALGKLGGRELNYASDVDLLLIGPAGLDERAGAAFLALLSDATADGVGLRVDLTLRPGGRAGVLLRSLPATLAYYEREAATAERQGTIKGRQ